LYIKDDDYRYSVVAGNFITLTNLSDEDRERILAQHLSPLHISVHALDPRVRDGHDAQRSGRAGPG
jgi:NifB/MoaA-like Fe-S oxidoreductase